MAGDVSPVAMFEECVVGRTVGTNKPIELSGQTAGDINFRVTCQVYFMI